MKKYILLFFLLVLAGITTRASVIDSLKFELNKAQTDTKKVVILLDIANQYYYDQPDTALKFCETALIHAEKAKHPYYLGNALSWVAYLKKNKGDIPGALKAFYQSLKWSTEAKDTANMLSILSNIAGMHAHQGDKDRSKAVTDEWEALAIANNNLRSLGGAYVYRAYSISQEKGAHPKAIDYYNKALNIYEDLKDTTLICNAKHNLAYVHMQTGDFEKALDMFADIMSHYEKTRNLRPLVAVYATVARIHVNLKNHNKALIYAKKGMDAAKKINFPEELKRAAFGLTSAYEAKGDYKNALETFRYAVNMRDSISNLKFKKEAIAQAEKYKYEIQAAADSARYTQQLKTKDAQEKLLEARNNRNILLGVGSIGLLIVIAAFMLLWARRTQKANQLLASKNQEIEYQREQLESKNKEVTDSLVYAQRIQQAILPPDGIMRIYLKDLFVYYQPKDVVAGDFYWMENMDGTTLLAVADCTGHGVPGAIVSVVCHNALNNALQELKTIHPAEILNKANQTITEQFATGEHEVKDGMDISLVSYNPKSKELLYAGANNPLYHISDGQLHQIEPDKQPVGMFAESKPFNEKKIQLKEGDGFYLFTDGFPDQFGGPKGKKFKYKPFKELLLAGFTHSPAEQQEKLTHAFGEWKGDLEQIDDVCVIGVKV